MGGGGGGAAAAAGPRRPPRRGLGGPVCEAPVPIFPCDANKLQALVYSFLGPSIDSPGGALGDRPGPLPLAGPAAFEAPGTAFEYARAARRRRVWRPKSGAAHRFGARCEGRRPSFGAQTIVWRPKHRLAPKTSFGAQTMRRVPRGAGAPRESCPGSRRAGSGEELDESARSGRPLAETGGELRTDLGPGHGLTGARSRLDWPLAA